MYSALTPKNTVRNNTSATKQNKDNVALTMMTNVISIAIMTDSAVRSTDNFLTLHNLMLPLCLSHGCQKIWKPVCSATSCTRNTAATELQLVVF